MAGGSYIPCDPDEQPMTVVSPTTLLDIETLRYPNPNTNFPLVTD